MELLFIYLLRFFSYQPYWNGSILLDLQDDDKKDVPVFLWTAVNVFCNYDYLLFLEYVYLFGISMEALRIGRIVITSGSLLSGELVKKS
jgi:hypothetical protein